MVSCAWNILLRGCHTWSACWASARTRMWVAILFQFKRKKCLCFCIYGSFTMSLSVLPTPEQLDSMTIIADVRDYAEVTSTVWNTASESLGNVTAFRVFGLVTLARFRQSLPTLRIPQQAVQGQEVPPRHLASIEVIEAANHVEFVEASSCRGQMWIPFWFRLQCHSNCCFSMQTARSSNRQRRRRCQQSSSQQGRSCATARADCCHGREMVTRDEEP